MYGLKLNSSKTQVTVIGSSRLIVKTNWHVLPQVSFGGVIIPNSDIVKNLEIYIDKTLS